MSFAPLKNNQPDLLDSGFPLRCSMKSVSLRHGLGRGIYGLAASKPARAFALGRLGERGQASSETAGLKFLYGNFKGEQGEIDLVFREGKVLVFRGESAFLRILDPTGGGRECRQAATVVATAREYVRMLPEGEVPIRFDIVEVLLEDGRVREVRHQPMHLPPRGCVGRLRACRNCLKSKSLCATGPVLRTDHSGCHRAPSQKCTTGHGEAICRWGVRAKILQVRRRAKYLLFDLKIRSNATVLLLGHLGMTGRMYVQSSRAALLTHGREVRLNRGMLVFEDTRYFGRMTLDTLSLEKLGPEPLSDQFNGRVLQEGLRVPNPSNPSCWIRDYWLGWGTYTPAKPCGRQDSPRKLSPPLCHTMRPVGRCAPGSFKESIEAGSTIPLDFRRRDK